MGDEYEVLAWTNVALVNMDGNLSSPEYEDVQLYAGDSLDDATHWMKVARDRGVRAIKLIWRPVSS